MKKFMTILLILIGLVAVFCIAVAARPSDFVYTRSATINAPPAAVFAQVNDLHNWQAWSPWAKIDPAAKTSYGGPAAGVGASFSWAGNAKLGEGSMAITESHPDELIRFKLDFVKPFKGNNIAEFTFKPVGNQTAVTWTMSGKCNFVSKAVGMFIDCEKMCGGQFEQGLAQLGTVTETSIKK